MKEDGTRGPEVCKRMESHGTESLKPCSGQKKFGYLFFRSFIFKNPAVNKKLRFKDTGY